MSFRYPAGLITASSPVNANYPSGVWTPRQALPYLQNGVWGQDTNFNQTVLLLHGDGTNGAQNNTFLDGSTNNFTITRNGNTTQGTFSPFSLAAGEWSNFFDGTGDYLSVADNAAFDLAASDFTFECWVYTTAYNSQYNCLISQWDTSLAYRFFFTSTTTTFGYYSGSSQTLEVTGQTNNLNEWIHFCVTRSGNTLTIYKNGTSIGTKDITGVTINNASVPLWISGLGTGSGSINNTTTHFGYISNLRLVKGTATAPPAGGPTSPLTNVTNTSLLTCQSNRFVDNGTANSGTGFTITRNGDVRVTPFSPFAPTAAYSAGTNGGSGYFDGNTDYLTAASNAAFAFGTGDFTIEAWINPASLATDTLICGVDVTNGAILGYSTTTVWLGSRGTAYDLTATYTLPLNSWTHIAVSRQGTTARLFANGVQIASGTVTKNYPQGLFTVGNYTAVNIGVNGYLYNVRAVKGTAVYTGAFTPPIAPVSTSGAASASAYPSTTNVDITFSSSNTSLLCNFTNAGIFDNTGKNNLETVGNAQIDTAVKKYGTGSMEFDGTDDRIFTPSSVDLIMGTGNFTIEGWFYANSTSNKGIFQLSSTTGGLDPSAATANIAFALQTNGYSVYAANVGTTITSVVPSTSTWTHFAVVRSSGVTRLYINGSQAGSNITDTTNYAGGNLVVGGYYSTSFLFNGFIDDLRITKGVARYTANFVPPIARFPNQ